MSTSQAQRVEFLAQLALFQDLNEQDLLAISARLNDFSLDVGQILYASGDRAGNFYFLLKGAVLNSHPDETATSNPSSLAKGDYFGEKELLENEARNATISAQTDASLLYMPRRDFEWMLARFPELAETLALGASTENLKREVDFDWLRENEELHFVARKHIAYLWLRLTRALGLAIIAFLAFYYAIDAPLDTQFNWLAAGAAILMVAVAMAFWEAFDWRNDYYILTNLRVVWLENRLLRSSSRKEAPLSSIQSINTHTSLLGRMLSFGDVIVRTYTGTVLMPAVAEPLHIKQLIEEYVLRLRQKDRKEEHDTIRQAVRQSLGQQIDQTPAADQPEDISETMMDKGERFQLFKTRQVDGVVVTYHKHWFVLFRALIFPTLFFFAALYFLFSFETGLSASTNGLLISASFILLPIIVFIYRVLDWQNDIYRVTADSLIDSEKKPLGSEVTKSAQLTNVLSLENHRIGILGLILNFGIVRINVGDSSLEFSDVYDPAQIQQDIFIRMEALKNSAEKIQAEDERKRMAEWLQVFEEERGKD
jgi:hypothetical protein